jgi:uncharacterized protein YndB with AHSA1/START domain
MNTTATMRRLDEKRGAIRVEDVYDTGIDDLWDACTTPERLSRWMATELSGDLHAGGSIHATFTSSWTGPARIEACDQPHHLLTLEPGTDDQTEVEAWLTEVGEGTRLVVEERGLPVDRLHFHGAGWQAHLEDLSRSLAGQGSVWRASWTELMPAYEAMPLG